MLYGNHNVLSFEMVCLPLLTAWYFISLPYQNVLFSDGKRNGLLMLRHAFACAKSHGLHILTLKLDGLDSINICVAIQNLSSLHVVSSCEWPPAEWTSACNARKEAIITNAMPAVQYKHAHAVFKANRATHGSGDKLKRMFLNELLFYGLKNQKKKSFKTPKKSSRFKPPKNPSFTRWYAEALPTPSKICI